MVYIKILPMSVMKYSLIYFVLILSSASIFSQDTKKGIIINCTDSLPVAFATIKGLNVNFGTFSNESGEFEISPSVDSVIISCVGYSQYKIAANTITAKPICLQPLILELPEISVKNMKMIGTETLGISLSKADFYWGPSGKGEEFAQKIHLTQSENEVIKIRKVILYAENFANEYPVVLHLYSENKMSGKPDLELLNKQF